MGLFFVFFLLFLNTFLKYDISWFFILFLNTLFGYDISWVVFILVLNTFFEYKISWVVLDAHFDFSPFPVSSYDAMEIYSISWSI